MLSLTPSISGITQQMPRTIRSISTPARPALSSALMIALSEREFIFATMRAPRPARACPRSRSIKSSNVGAS